MAQEQNPKNIVISYIFNSPVLVPWKVVEHLQGPDDDDKRTEAMLLWYEVYREKNRFKENDFVCEQGNSTLKMTVRRILRQEKKDEATGEVKKRLLGLECYWWAPANEAMAQIMEMNMRGRKVPGATVLEETVV